MKFSNCKTESMSFQPSYLNLYASGELEERSKIAQSILTSCNCCPHDCRVNRYNNEQGICVSPALPIVSSYTPHFGEEPVLSGSRGAGNIFFGNCNLKCVFCQNHEISQNYKSEIHHKVSYERLAEIMLELQDKNCHNIGLVSPTHFSASILRSIYVAASKGLNLPIIYNTNAYDTVEILKLYDGIADIYLPDIKYGSSEFGKLYSKVDNYFEHARNSVKEMFRQVGSELVYDGDVIVRGLIIRHLVLPNNLAETETVFRFIAEELSPYVHISLMSQYRPVHKAYKYTLINRQVREREYENAVNLLDKYGLKNGWVQELDSSEYYNPAFNLDRVNPFGNDNNIHNVITI